MKEKNFFSLTLNDVACGSYFGSCCCPVKSTVEKGVSLPGITFSQRHITFFLLPVFKGNVKDREKMREIGQESDLGKVFKASPHS